MASETRDRVAVLRATRLLIASLLVIRLLVLGYYVRLAAGHFALPVQDDFFPALLRSPQLLLAAVALPLITEVLALASPTSVKRKSAAVLELTSASVLLLHQGSFFSATWLVAFWAATFLCWLCWSGQRDAAQARRVGPFLAQLIIALLFLGGAVGKWTGVYWSGEAFHELLFARPGFPYELVRSNLSVAQQQTVALWFSRVVVVVESATMGVAFLPVLPATVLGISAALGLWLFGAPEVSLTVIGLALTGWVLAD